LESILDYEAVDPSIDAAFHQSATCPGCTDVTAPACSCTDSFTHWSSTTLPGGGGEGYPLGVGFGLGGTAFTKTDPANVRAVRGGAGD